MNHKWLTHAQNHKFYIFILFRYTKYLFVWSFSNLLYNCSRSYIFSRLLRFFTFEIFPILTRVAQTFKNTMLNKSGYFRTPASMKKSTALDFWRKSEKPEMESYIIYHDFGKIQVKNTASYWILPYINRMNRKSLTGRFCNFYFLRGHVSIRFTNHFQLRQMTITITSFYNTFHT